MLRLLATVDLRGQKMGSKGGAGTFVLGMNDKGG